MKVFKALVLKDKREKTLIIRAKDELGATKKLKGMNLKVLELTLLTQRSFFHTQLKAEVLAFLYKEFALLLGSGISFTLALQSLLDNPYDKNLSLFLQEIKYNLSHGQSLAQAFENTSFTLSQSELTLIKMGENTGDLAFIFSKLCELKEKSLDNQKRIKKALSYPLFVFISLIIAFACLILFVMPQFKMIFDDFGINLPLITRILFGVYEFLDEYYFVLLICMIFCICVFYFAYTKITIFSLWVDFLLLKIPFVKNMIFYNEFCTFFLVFSLLLKNKVDFLTAFFLASSSLKNKFLCKKCKHISTLCQQGLSPDEAFKKSHLFEGVVLSMLNIAMKSAKLDLMSEKISNFYETKQENLMSKFIFLLEPLMTFLVAILVLCLALGIFLPMWELNSSISF